jgi:DnaK suppressor protein
LFEEIQYVKSISNKLENRMTDKAREEIKNIILEKIAELKDVIASMEAEQKPVAPDNAYGRLSRMEAIGSKAIFDAGLEDKKVLMQRLEHALSNCDSPRFGVCAKCNQDISHARLVAIPYASLCIKCA